MAVEVKANAQDHTTSRRKKLDVIDTDVHHNISSVHDLLPYLNDHWKRYITDYGWKPIKTVPFHQVRQGTKYRADTFGGERREPGSDFQLLKEQLLDEQEITFAILGGWFHEATVANGWFEFAAARAAAYNDYTIHEWLEKDERLRGSVTIPSDPKEAVKEIERVGSHPQMVQVMMSVGNFAWGDPYYHPIFEAAHRQGLAIGMHLSADISFQGGDFLRYYVAWRSAHPQAYMTQVISLITNGVFDKFPDLKVAMIEGGFEWVPFMMNRMDAAYKGLRQETPWVKRMPSDYFRENLKFCTQPWHDLSVDHFLNIVDMMGSEDMLMFSTDYPHWDFDSPKRTLPPKIPQGLKEKILYKNAKELYKL
ncbi:amidohydrolase family protein [Caldalkalibacillus salinus]|uniref:amidohydrolase family protein n=1 Tax=Caldalkalibacillus salinus TaxID=2803787 RepID=UPI001922EC75|nr:amidohydrolase family protein [Caldalkalibacillus salinus]